MKQVDVLIIHEVGEPSHYAGLVTALGPESRIRFVEFSTLRLVVRGLKKQRIDLVAKAIGDLAFLLRCFLLPSSIADRLVVLGIAPLDYRLAPMVRIISKARVVYHSSWTVWDGSFFPRRTRSKRVATIWREFLQSVGRIAAVTPTTKVGLLHSWGVADERVDTVYHSYDASIFHPPQLPTDKRDQRISAIYVGRLVREKGIAELIDLATRLPWLDIKIVGDGYMREEVVSASADLPNLSYHGYVSDRIVLADLYRNSQVVMLPSMRTSEWEELFGMALVEAMACGCIPLCTPHPGPTIILQPDELVEFCLLPEASFVDDAAERLTMLRLEPTRMSALSTCAHLAAERFSIDSISAVWRRLVSKVQQ
ncbi:glycosyltransferase family 4 protein [Stenotrophomonas bentonitica]|uniref:glycosyltransferase family 4 protein n=1 Tax=Stenotrophomonas bentonitica TaxID=1450134 RepID=UPI0036E3E6C9